MEKFMVNFLAGSMVFLILIILMPVFVFLGIFSGWVTGHVLSWFVTVPSYFQMTFPEIGMMLGAFGGFVGRLVTYNSSK